MAKIITEDSSVYFRCKVGSHSYGFSLKDVAVDKQQWVADLIEAEISRAYELGLSQGDRIRLEKIKEALSV